MDIEKLLDTTILNNKELILQNEEKEKYIAELIISKKELEIENEKKENIAFELIIANQKLFIQNKENIKLAEELTLTNENLTKSKSEIIKLNQDLEEKITKRTAQYHFISEINQSIVHVRDEETLLRNACLLAYEIGKFKMAWLGLFDIPNKKISLVEQCGILEEDLKLFHEARYDDRGPQYHVLHNSTYYCSNDIETDLNLENWKPFAAKHDIRSCMVLPITKSGQIIGTFNLYSTEINFFGKEEILLLLEVTGDFSFALDILEKEKKLKATEELLLKNEKRFRALVENGTDGIVILSSSGSPIYISPTLEKMLGYTEEDVRHFNMFSLVHPNHIESLAKIWEQVLAAPGIPIYGHTSQVLHKDGTWRWLEATNKNMLHEPSVNGIVVNFRDITEKVKAEQQKEFDKNNMDALINNTKDLMWSVDKDLKVISFNQPFHDTVKQNTGISLSKGSGILSGALSLAQLNQLKLYYERAFAGESFTEIEYHSIPSESWLEVSYNPILKGEEFIGAACHSRDITQIMLHEKTIKNERILLRTLIDNLPSLIYTKDMYSRKTLANRADFEYLGVASEDEVLGKDDSWFFSEETSRKTLLEEQQIFNTGVPILNKEEYQLKKDGGTTWFLISKIPLKNQHNENVGLLGISHDITERKEVEQQLKRSEAFNIGVLNSLNLHIAVVNGNGDIIAVNDVWKRFSIANGEPNLSCTGVGSNYIDVCRKGIENADETSVEVLRGMKDVFDGKITDFNLEYPCHSPVEKRWFGMRIMKFDNDEPMVVVAHLDITQRKLAEERLLLTQFAIDNVGDCVFWITPDARIIKVNDAACLTLGYTQEELLELSVPDIDINYNVEKWPIHFVELREQGSLIFETTQRAKDGRLIPCEIIANYIKFGDLEYNCAFSRDITERKMAEEEREKITTALVQRNKELEQFSYIVSHNLRSPVANILGLSAMAQDESLESDMRKDVLEGMNQSVKKLDGVISDLNNILQTKRDVSQMKEMVSFSQIVSGIHISIAQQIDKENATILCDFVEIDEILTLKSYMHSIFYNLISNSLKYRQPTIPPVIEITSRQLKSTIELIFQDNGMGIDLSKKGEQVFGLYKRFHTEAADGKGMGLYMVKTQVEAIGGKISIESAVNKGTTFKIEFYNKKFQ